jgi:hypothetical protein
MPSTSNTPTPAPTTSVGAATADTIHEASYYTDKLKNLAASFKVQTAKLADAYVSHKLFPTNTEYENMYTRMLVGVNKAKADMFELQNEVEVMSAEYREKIDILSNDIQSDRTRENDIVKDFEQAEDSGAAGARKGLTDTYKLQYASNFFMFLGIILAMVILFKVFSPGSPSPDIPTPDTPVFDGS